jgi:hypothetical protein
MASSERGAAGMRVERASEEENPSFAEAGSGISDAGWKPGPNQSFDPERYWVLLARMKISTATISRISSKR